jgi:hypothetical protein
MAIPMGELITPSSVAGSGVSLSGAKVVFTAATTINVNGVFDSTYDNYLVVCRAESASNPYVNARLRLSGTDNTTASSYVAQRLLASSTTVSGARFTNDYAFAGAGGRAVDGSGSHVYFYGPALSQPTAARTVTVSDNNGGEIYDIAWTHNQSTAYDGFTFYPNTSDLTGSLTVYGLSQ